MSKINSKRVLIIAIIVSLLFAVGCVWYIVGKIFEEASEARSTYSSSINESGQIVYTKVDEEGEPVTDENGEPITFTIDELVDAQKDTLKSYIPGDDETYNETIKYLIEAESVTTMPYIDGISEEELNGQIKFYRYTDSEDEVNAEDVNEDNRLTYMPLEEFNAKMEAYKSNATHNKDIFKHFTIDEEGTVLIAYGSEEYRVIETGVEGAKDFELTEEVVNGATSGTGTYKGEANSKFQMYVNTINTKPVDYLSLVEQYVMPTNLLYSLLVASGDIDFVMEVAGLAYQNEIAIGIYDNQNYRTMTETYEYKKAMNIEVATNFEYEDVLVSINGSNLLTEAELGRSPYTSIIAGCVSKTVNHKISHNVDYKAEGLTGWTEVNPEIHMLVDGENSIGEITNLGEGQTYKTQYTKIVDAMSSPTIGVLLADTWIARWEATYTKKVEPLPGSSGETTLDNTVTISYESSDINSSEIFAEFANNLDNTIKEKAGDHADDLIEETIAQIIDQTPDSKFEVAAETASLTLAEKKDILKEHVNGCSICGWCLSIIGKSSANLSKDELYTILTDSTLQSRMPPYFSTNMPNHIQGIFDAELRERQQQANNAAASSEDAKKREFIRQLIDECPIEPFQTIAGSKEYVNIKNNYSSSGNSTKYEKSETVSRTEEGEKFKKIFNKLQYYDAKQAILRRETWLWEFIRANEDTEKLEDILRYMLNIATGTKKFGEFEDLDSLFAAFKPKELNATQKTGHLQAFSEWLKSYENEPLRQYMKEGSSYSYESVEKYVTEDKKYGKMYYTEIDGCLNYTYGIMVRNKNGQINNKSYFKKYGYDLEALLQEYDAGGDALVEMEILEKIKLDLINDKYNVIKTTIEGYEANGVKLGVTMEVYQYYALTSVAYQYGNCGQYIEDSNNVAVIYKKYYIDEENSEGFRQNAVCKTSSGGYAHYFTGTNYAERKENTWILFNEGRYILSNGEEIFASSKSIVAEFALQFKGQTAAGVRLDDDPPGGLFEYITSDGVAFANQEWCADFVSYCFDKCGMLSAIGGTYQSCTIKMNLVRNTELFRGNDYVPEVGDVIFYTDDGGVTSYHTGIVTGCDGTRITTIEGNMGHDINSASTVKSTNYHCVGDVGIY